MNITDHLQKENRRLRLYLKIYFGLILVMLATGLYVDSKFNEARKTNRYYENLIANGTNNWRSHFIK